jgi:uncharacterized protein (DUF1330 family)
MIYLTQLIYIKAGCEDIFDAFEAKAIPLIARYGGQLLLRFRPGTVIEANMPVPYEVHFICFPSTAHFESFRHDGERLSFLHLKDQSVQESILVSGVRL